MYLFAIPIFSLVKYLLNSYPQFKISGCFSFIIQVPFIIELQEFFIYSEYEPFAR